MIETRISPPDDNELQYEEVLSQAYELLKRSEILPSPFNDREEEPSEKDLKEIESDRGNLSPEYLYYSEAAQHNLLTAKQEVDLSNKYLRGRKAQEEVANRQVRGQEVDYDLVSIIKSGFKARDDLANSNLRLVISYARRFLGRGLPLLDLIQEGNLGLLRAIDKYDPEKGFRFSTYATWWIRQAVGRSVQDDSNNVRIPVHVQERLSRLSRGGFELQHELGREVTKMEVGEKLGMSKRQVEDAIRASSIQPLSLEMPMGFEDDATLADYVADPENIEDKIEKVAIRDGVLKILDEVLKPKERRILEKRFGLIDGIPMSLGDIGKEEGISRERVRQIESIALKKLRINPDSRTILRELY